MRDVCFRGVRLSRRFEDIIGVDEVHSLDNLLMIYHELQHETRIPVRDVTEVLQKELSTKELVTVFKRKTPPASLSAVRTELDELEAQISDKLYYFLWSLANRELLSVRGVIDSLELKRAIFYLTKFIATAEYFLKNKGKHQEIFERLAAAYLDFAGIARYAPDGLVINGRRLFSSVLLRKAIMYFQKAIQFEAYQSKAIDDTHARLLKLIEASVDFPQQRIYLYLNPWNFLYISSALMALNDREGALLYLEPFRFILHNICEHQNPAILKQQHLLHSVHNALTYGEAVSFDFDERKLRRLKNKLKWIRRIRKGSRNARACYSPMVEGALWQEYHSQKAFVRHGVLQPEQANYLHGIQGLYEHVSSTLERDKLIFRVNIPPLRINGVQKPFKVPSTRLLTQA